MERNPCLAELKNCLWCSGGFLYSSRGRARGAGEVTISSWLPCGYWRKWQYLFGSYNRTANAEQAQGGNKMKINKMKGIATHSVFLPGKSHRRRSLVGCSPWGHDESDTTKWLHFHFSLSCIGEGNGNPLHRSCLENPRDGGAWWAAVYGVAQSRTRLKRLSSSISPKVRVRPVWVTPCIKMLDLSQAGAKTTMWVF